MLSSSLRYYVPDEEERLRQQKIDHERARTGRVVEQIIFQCGW